MCVVSYTRTVEWFPRVGRARRRVTTHDVRQCNAMHAIRTIQRIRSPTMPMPVPVPVDGLGAIRASRRRDVREDDRDDRLDDKKKCRRIVASVEAERARRRRDSIERVTTRGDGG